MQETVKIKKPYVYNGSFSIKKFIYPIVIFSFIGIFAILYQKNINSNPNVMTKINPTPIEIIFYQPLLKDKMDWDKTFQQLKQVHIKKLVLQWSKFGVVDFLKKEQWLKTILSIAQKHQIKVIVGLYGDNKYFKTLEDRKTDIPKYLKNLKAQNIVQARKIYTIAKNYDSFDGYYIYDEIDDTNFKEKERQVYLKAYLETLALSLNNISKHPLYLSGYFSNHMKPLEYANMFSEITQHKYTVLLQSGIGANLVNNQRSALYIQTFSNNFKGSFIPIIEGFKMEGNKIKSIDFNSLYQQIELIRSTIENKPMAIFSLRYFLDTVVFKKYLSHYKKL